MKLLKFTADWCASCKALSSKLENFELCEIDEIDVEEEVDITIEFNVRSLPTIILIDDEERELDRIVGNVSVKTIEDLVNKHLNNQ